MKEEKCHHDDMMCHMDCLTNKAWDMLMLEKMKQAFEKERGTNMTKAAKMCVKHSMELWTLKMKKGDMKAELPKADTEKFMKDLNKTFMS